MTDAQMLDAIRHIMAIHEFNVEDEDGDKYLSDHAYVMEAIDAILNGYESGILRQFLEAVIPS